MDLWKGFESYVLLFFLLVVAVAMVIHVRRGKRARESWKALARSYGLIYQPPKPLGLFSKKAAVAFQDPGEVYGEWEGLPFHLYIAVYGTSKDRRVFTVMSVKIPDLPPGLTIYHENAFLAFTKLLGAQDIITGDAPFDKAFRIKGTDQSRVLAWLDERRRQAMMKTIAGDADMDIREGGLHFQQGQVVDDLEVLKAAFQKMKSLIPYLRPSRKTW